MERPLQTQHTQPTPSTATSTVTTPRTASPAPREPDGTLRLRGGPVEERRVQWGEDVVDNEGLGRKKSKVCCIYHRPRRYDESSSDESSDSSSDESDDCADGCSHGKGKGKEKKPRKNAYEKMPKNQKRQA